MLEVKVNTGNSAFRDPITNELDRAGYEAIKILEHVIFGLKQCYDGGNLVDTNGNHVGTWRYNDEYENSIANVWDIVLEDDTTSHGGTDFSGETVGEFAETVGFDKSTSIDELNNALAECGIRTIEKL